jgi:hypothetical protein
VHIDLGGLGNEPRGGVISQYLLGTDPVEDWNSSNKRLKRVDSDLLPYLEASAHFRDRFYRLRCLAISKIFRLPQRVNFITPASWACFRTLTR